MKAFFGRITALALQFRYITLLLVVVLMTLGVYAWTIQKQELLPPIEFPQTFILAQASGMTSDEVLEILTKRIEAELVKIPEIINLESTTTSTIGAFITAANDFGLNQERLRASMIDAIDRVWLPKRILQAPNGTDASTFATRLIADLPAEVLIYLAEQDSNFLFQLSLEVWQTFNDETARQALAYLAGRLEQTTDAKNALELLVNKEIVPQLNGLPDVANVAVAGGQELPEALNGEAQATPVPVLQTTPESLLLRLSPKIWDSLSERLNLGELDENAIATLSTVAYTIPQTAPQLPQSWQLNPDGTSTRFITARDLIEVRTLTTSVGGLINNFYTNGRIVGALGQTDDLSLEDVQRMLAIAPTMATYFTGEQLVALPIEIRELLIANGATLDAFAIDGLAAVELAEALTGESATPIPVNLPNQWRIAYPQLISFSFADLPLVTYSVSSVGEIVIETDTPIITALAVTDTYKDPNAPALPASWSAFARQFSGQLGVEIAFADASDLFNPDLPGGFPGVVNLVYQAGAGTFLRPILTTITPEIAEYLLSREGDFFLRMNIDALNALPTAVKEIPTVAEAIAYNAIPALPSGWNTLASQPQFATNPLNNGADVARLGDGVPSVALNQIYDTLEATYPDYARRLFSTLSVDIVRYWATLETDFYANVKREILEEFDPATLQVISQDEAFSAVYDATTTADIIAIATASMPQTNNGQQAQGPALNPEWAGIAPFYNLTLDTADDLLFPEPILLFGSINVTNAGDLINSFYGNTQGTNAAKGILGNMPEDAFRFVLENDPTGFDTLIPRALRDLPANLLALLSEEIQARANQVEFVPQTQITRTNGNPSLFVTVSKGRDSNTVTSFKEVDAIMRQLDAENPNITTSIVFEQSSIVENSINGVARDGSLGATFAIIIILIFLSGGDWGKGGRKITGIVLSVVALILFVGLLASGLNDANNDWGQAFSNADPVLRVLLMLGFVAGLVITFYTGKMSKPSWRTTIVIAVSIPLSIMVALVGMTWVSPALREVVLPLAENEGALQGIFKFMLNLFPDQITLNIMTLSGLTVAVGRVVDDSIVVLENIFNQLKKGGDKKTVIIQGAKEVSAAIFTATLIALVVFLPLGLTGGIIGAFFLPFGLAVTYALIGSFTVAITVIPVLAYFLIGKDDTPDEDRPFWITPYYLPALRWALSSPLSKAMVIGGAVLSIGFAGYLFSQRPFAFIPDFGEQQITVNVSLEAGTSILVTNEKVTEFERYLAEESPFPTGVVKNVQVTVGGGGASFATLIGGNAVNESRANIAILLNLQPGEADAYIEDIRANAERIFGGAEYVTVSAGSLSGGGFGGLSIVVSGPAEELAPLNNLIIETMNGIEGIANVTSNFVDPNVDGDTPPTYIRINQEVAFSYSGDLETENTIGVQQLAVNAIQALPEVANNPNIKVSRGFTSELQAQGFVSLFAAMGIAIMIMVVLLTATSQSFTYWLAIIFAIVVAPVGAAIGLTLTNRVLGIPALTGLLMLFGLVISNAVVLIDRVRANLTERNMPLKEALIEAGGRRLRPILMTSLTTIIGLTPLAIGLSDGAIIAAELGIVVIGGVISSTLLTLIVTPVMFSLLHPIHRILSIRRGKSAPVVPQPAGD